MINYTKAKKYATKCGYGTDLVHDAYLDWYKKTGNNLMEEPEHRIMAILGWCVRRKRNEGMQMWRGEKHFRRYISFPDLEYGKDGEASNEFMLPVEPNQYGYCSYNDIVNHLDNRLKYIKGFTRRVYELMKLEYTVADIAEAEGTYLQRVRHEVNKIRYIAGSNKYYVKNANYYRVRH